MSSPTTLPALRLAVARVLVARGEATDALVCSAHRVSRGHPRGKHWYARVVAPWESTGSPPSWASDMWAATEGEACALAWGRIAAAARDRVTDYERGVASAQARLDRAQAALAAAREIEGSVDDE
jgi:hypothetical protein